MMCDCFDGRCGHFSIKRSISKDGSLSSNRFSCDLGADRFRIDIEKGEIWTSKCPLEMIKVEKGD